MADVSSGGGRNTIQMTLRCGDCVFPISATTLKAFLPGFAAIPGSNAEITLERSVFFQDAVATMRAQHSRGAA